MRTARGLDHTRSTRVQPLACLICLFAVTGTCCTLIRSRKMLVLPDVWGSGHMLSKYGYRIHNIHDSSCASFFPRRNSTEVNTMAPVMNVAQYWPVLAKWQWKEQHAVQLCTCPPAPRSVLHGLQAQQHRHACRSTAGAGVGGAP